MQYPAQATPYVVGFAVHDALVRHLPGRPLAPSLAESYEVADDYLSATFRLREGITFHNGEPVTVDDVIFTYENYRGTAADLFKAKTARIETPDERTVRFGIRTTLQTMERAAFQEALTKGVDALPGLIINISSAPGDAASRIRAFATCEGSSSRTCIPELDATFAAYEAAADPAERSRLITEAQRILLDQYVFPFVYTQTNLGVFGPKIATAPEEVYGPMPQFPLLAPYEDVELNG